MGRGCRAAGEPAPLFKIDGYLVTPDMPALQKAFGSTDPAFIEGLLQQLVNIGSPGDVADEQGTDFIAAIVRDVKPRNTREAMVATQMAGLHCEAMRQLRRAITASSREERNDAVRLANACSRTYAKLYETLHKARGGGRQEVTVRHLTVKQGGQAIVGNVGTGKGGGDHAPADDGGVADAISPPPETPRADPRDEP